MQLLMSSRSRTAPPSGIRSCAPSVVTAGRRDRELPRVSGIEFGDSAGMGTFKSLLVRQQGARNPRQDDVKMMTNVYVPLVSITAVLLSHV